MSEFQILAVIAAVAFLYSLVATRLELTPVNGALVYVTVGLLCGPAGLGLLDLDVDGEGIKRLAEFTLAIVLFTDAANANLSVLRRFERLPIRLLLVGLPLTIVFGFGFGVLLFGDVALIEIALLATMLAPTDAALGKAVVTNPAVPDSIREGLNVESGLNDGICVPVLLIFLALATGSSGSDSLSTLIVTLPLQAIGVGAVVGVVFAVIGSSLLRLSSGRGWIAGSWEQIPVIALAMVCFATSQQLGGSGFIASFVGGMLFGALTRHHKERVLRAAEGAGDTLALITWLVFGAVFVGDQLHRFDPSTVFYAVLSLTLVRIIPVFLSVAGLGLRWDTKLFMGWFGPRGLASIVFIVIVAEQHLPSNETLVSAVVWTILLSIVAHGLTANPLARLFASRVKARRESI